MGRQYTVSANWPTTLALSHGYDHILRVMKEGKMVLSTTQLGTE